MVHGYRHTKLHKQIYIQVVNYTHQSHTHKCICVQRDTVICTGTTNTFWINRCTHISSMYTYTRCKHTHPYIQADTHIGRHTQISIYRDKDHTCRDLCTQIHIHMHRHSSYTQTHVYTNTQEHIHILMDTDICTDITSCICRFTIIHTET